MNCSPIGGPDQSHAFIHSRVHSFIQQLILTEQAHSPALDWALATLASASLDGLSPSGGRPGGCPRCGRPRR